MARRVNRQGLEEAAAMFKALADPARLQTLIILAGRERNVGDLADIEGDKTGTVSARLKVLLQARLVRRRRDGKSVIYSVADRHVLNMIENAVDHATERPRKRRPPKEPKMSTCNLPKHENHAHQHGPGCGHTAVRHGDHVDYLHDGHLHHPHDDHVDEHKIEVSGKNPGRCTPDHRCAGHEAGHVHGPGCGHQAVPHGDHVDYLVDGHLHHPHGDHCDDHGPLEVVR